MLKDRLNTLNFTRAIIFLFIFIYSCLYPLAVDDLVYSNADTLHSHEIIHSILWNYQNWTGRISAQFLADIFLNKSYNDYSIILISIITGICFVAFLDILYLACFREKPDNKKSSLYVLFVLFLVLFLIKIDAMRNMIGFKTVAIQYFWGITLALCASLYIHRKDKLSFIGSLFTFLIGLFIGVYNEIIAASLIVFYFFFYFSINYNYYIRKLFSNKIYFLLGSFIGFCVLISAPGNYVRKKVALGDTSYHPTLLQKIHTVFIQYYNIMPFKKSFSILVLILLCCCYFLTKLSKNSSNDKKYLANYFKLSIAFIFSLVILSPFAYYYVGMVGRVVFVPDIILFILMIGLSSLLADMVYPSYKSKLELFKIPFFIILVVL